MAEAVTLSLVCCGVVEVNEEPPIFVVMLRGFEGGRSEMEGAALGGLAVYGAGCDGVSAPPGWIGDSFKGDSNWLLAVRRESISDPSAPGPAWSS